MLRFYRQFMEQVLLVLIWARDQAGTADCSGFLRYSTDRWRHMDVARYPFQTEDVIRTARVIQETNRCEEWDLSAIITTISQQIWAAHSHDGSSDKDLIDSIVRSLQLPFPRSRFSGDTLASLKRALLLPDEMVGLKEKLQKAELSCGQCGHKLENGEMATVLHDRNGNVLLCASCTTPSKIPCGAGKHSIAMPKTMAKAILREREKACEACAMEAAAENVEVPENIGRGAEPVRDVELAPARPRFVPVPPQAVQAARAMEAHENVLEDNPYRFAPQARADNTNWITNTFTIAAAPPNATDGGITMRTLQEAVQQYGAIVRDLPDMLQTGAIIDDIADPIPADEYYEADYGDEDDDMGDDD